MRFEISAPVADYTGRICGVAFADGKATVDTVGQARELSYFRRAGYGVQALDAEPAPEEEPATEEEPPVKRPAKSGSKADWVAFALAQGMTAEEADQLTRDQLAERFADPEGEGQ